MATTAFPQSARASRPVRSWPCSRAVLASPASTPLIPALAPACAVNLNFERRWSMPVCERLENVCSGKSRRFPSRVIDKLSSAVFLRIISRVQICFMVFDMIKEAGLSRPRFQPVADCAKYTVSPDCLLCPPMLDAHVQCAESRADATEMRDACTVMTGCRDGFVEAS